MAGADLWVWLVVQLTSSAVMVKTHTSYETWKQVKCFDNITCDNTSLIHVHYTHMHAHIHTCTRTHKCTHAHVHKLKINHYAVSAPDETQQNTISTKNNTTLCSLVTTDSLCVLNHILSNVLFTKLTELSLCTTTHSSLAAEVLTRFLFHVLYWRL